MDGSVEGVCVGGGVVATVPGFVVDGAAVGSSVVVGPIVVVGGSIERVKIRNQVQIKHYQCRVEQRILHTRALTSASFLTDIIVLSIQSKTFSISPFIRKIPNLNGKLTVRVAFASMASFCPIFCIPGQGPCPN